MMRSTAMTLLRKFKKHRLHKQIVVAMCLLFSTVIIFYFISPVGNEETLIVIKEGPNYEDDYPQYPDEAGTVVKQDIVYNWDDWADGNVKQTLQDVIVTVEEKVTSEAKTSSDKATSTMDKTLRDKAASLDKTSVNKMTSEDKNLLVDTLESEALKRDPSPMMVPPETLAAVKSNLLSLKKGQVTEEGDKLQLAAPDNKLR